MAKPRRLTMGIDSPPPSPHEEEARVAILQATVEKYLPDLAAAVKRASRADAGGRLLLLPQDAFAAGYDDDEYTLLGMAVKYAGLSGVEVRGIGKNHATF